VSEELKWLPKHKPKFVMDEYGTFHVEVHPEDAHLFDPSSLPQEGAKESED
jgi:hypothetical protein